MANPFELAAQKIAELGFFSFVIPFFVTSAVFYGLLKRSGIFSSVMVNGIISLSTAFLIWGFLISAPALEFGTALSKFTTQITLIILLFMFTLVGASLFYPDFPKVLGKLYSEKATDQYIWIFFGIFIFIFFTTSGLGKFTGLPSILGGATGTIVLVLLFLFIGVLLASTTVKS